MNYHVREINGKWFIYDFNDQFFAGFVSQEKADNTCRSMNDLTEWNPKLSVPVVEK